MNGRPRQGGEIGSSLLQPFTQVFNQGGRLYPQLLVDGKGHGRSYLHIPADCWNVLLEQTLLHQELTHIPLSLCLSEQPTWVRSQYNFSLIGPPHPWAHLCKTRRQEKGTPLRVSSPLPV